MNVSKNESIQEHVRDHFGSDWDKALAYHREGRKENITWNSIQLAAEFMPELEKDVEELINQHLGYLPHLHLYIVHEPFLRAIIKNYRKGQMTEAAFFEEVTYHLNLIEYGHI